MGARRLKNPEPESGFAGLLGIIRVKKKISYNITMV